MIFYREGSPGSSSQPEVILFTNNIGTLVGIFALAFMIHNMIVGIMKNNEKPEHNTRDLAIAYTIDFTVYIILGIMGQIAVAVLFSIYNADGSRSIPPVKQFYLFTYISNI